MKRLLLITTCLLSATTAQAQTATMQSPAYTECSALAASNPTQALAKADAWLKIDSGIAAQHCRAMALYGLRRFAEAGDGLSSVRDMVLPENISLRSYVTRQASRAYVGANMPERAEGILSAQIDQISTVKGDNASAAKLTSELLLERARLNVNYGKLDIAARDLDHAVSLTPVNEDVLMERAGVFEKLGDRALASNDVQAVMIINKENKKAQEMLLRLDGVVSAGSAADLSKAAPAAAAPEPVAPTKTQKHKKITPATQAP